MRVRLRELLIPAVVGLTACGNSGLAADGGQVASPEAGGSSEGGRSGDGALGPTPTPAAEAGSSSGGAHDDAATGGAHPCGATNAMPTTLAGTWDVQGSSLNATPLMATLIIDPTRFTFAVTNGDSLEFSSPSDPPVLTWHASGGSASAIMTTHSSASLNQGIIPLGLGGRWTFARGSAACQADIGLPQFTASCSGTSGLPFPLPQSIDGNVVGQRMSTLPSLFGDLGGTWHVAHPGAAGCDATFSGNTISVRCIAAPWGDGSASITVCDGIAAGSTSAGVEFSARRR